MSRRSALEVARGFPATLWDLLRPGRPEAEPAAGDEVAGRVAPPAIERSAGSERTSAAGGLRRRDRYDELVREMKLRHGVRVVRWRSSTSGCAWPVHYQDGTIARLIEAPYPKGPTSCAVFLHEVGHHAIGFRTYRPRCLEEYHAWRWSFEAMLARGLNLTPAVRRRRDLALHYAILKARRRGLKRLPGELAPFLSPPDEARPLPALLGAPLGPDTGLDAVPDAALATAMATTLA
ncbi:MAG: hypothetical protein VX672_00345 [Planctomycetota bacterium]|nr:hypothetical protein [Planctomycetota bacterium]